MPGPLPLSEAGGESVGGMGPTDAIVAVTLNCNSRCTMCDIWKNRMKDEMQPEEYRALPSSLKGVNITGGEPFMRKDLPGIIRVIKDSCPQARIVISSNGFLPDRVEAMIPDMLSADPNIAVRISIDGLEKTHETVRGIPGGFRRDMESLNILRRLGVHDLGIGMTVMESNISELPDVYALSRDLGVEMSVTIATDSEVFFGEQKEALRPRDTEALQAVFRDLIRSEYASWRPKRWFRAWYEKHLVRYALGHGRPIACDAGRGFFYLDSHGNVYACHILPTFMGSLRKQTWEEIWGSIEAEGVRAEIDGCERCWMICTAKSAVRKNLFEICLEVLGDKARIHLALQ